jgi:L-fuconolactonase
MLPVIIDAHQHFWAVGAPGHEWPTSDFPTLYRDYGAVELAEAPAGAGLVGTVLVQAQANDAGTDWLLRVADATPLVLGVVGWADMLAPNASERIATLAEHSKMRGLRPMLQSLPDDDWIANPGLDPAIDAMLAHRLTLDALVFTRHLPALERLAARCPDLPIVIDHAAKPAIDEPDAFDHWAQAIAGLAGFDQVYCKISGLLTEVSAGTPEAAFAPYVDHLITVFGPQRLMWGSDWPVVKLRTSYAEWLAMATRLCRPTTGSVDHIMYGTATRFYRLNTEQDR